MNTRPTTTRTLRQRRGVTLVELLVAMSLLTIGLLAIVGISGSVSRSLGESRNQSLAAMTAQSRFERLAGTSCTSFTLDTWTKASTRGVTENYRITNGKNATKIIEDTVTWKTRRTTRKQFFTTILPCRPGA